MYSMGTKFRLGLSYSFKSTVKVKYVSVKNKDYLQNLIIRTYIYLMVNELEKEQK